ncbi:MAG TPA: GNAT family N-acetyltransferase [Clostridiales bacterium]|nr:GNAT family N-acetyltransferase [Clostridiales bacterium]
MKIKQVKLKALEDTWKKMYSSNNLLFPYSSYEFASCYNKYFHLGSKRLFMKQLFFLISNDDKDVAIIPLICRKDDYYLYGDMCATGYLDIITAGEITDDEYSKIFELIFSKIGNATLNLNKINDRSRLFHYLLKYYTEEYSSPCVNISFSNDYDTYMKSLSKSVRQNIRTAYNRIQRENRTCNLKVIINESLPSEIINEGMKIYNKREENRNKKKSSLVTKIIRRHFNPITTSTLFIPNNIHALFFIDGDIAAFLSGYITNDNKTIVVPRHAININYSSYSAGTLLITELIRYCIDNTEIRNLDLSRGDEKYKYSLGGTTHYNHSFVLKHQREGKK